MRKLAVVGIGPGNYENMTIRADRALRECDVIVGYTVYVDLVKERYADKEFLTTPMLREVERCEMALETARGGKTVAMICSGDSGIYGMAALLYELRGEAAEPEIEVIPGLTAACSGGALLGAPLTHDFAVISLSNRLTPWEKIEKRLVCAAEADLGIVLYNPRSKGRPDNLRMACDILLRYLPEDRPCGVAHSIGREGETGEYMTLGALRDADIDDVVNLIRGIRGVRVAVHIKPRGERLYKLSMRCEQGFNVAAICAGFGGGGHTCAAGCTIADSVENAEEKVLCAIAAAFEAEEAVEAEKAA